jgi:hypothetical protein
MTRNQQLLRFRLAPGYDRVGGSMVLAARIAVRGEA